MKRSAAGAKPHCVQERQDAQQPELHSIGVTKKKQRMLGDRRTQSKRKRR